MILGIDPGNLQSAYVVLDENLKPVSIGKVDNMELLDMIYSGEFSNCGNVAIEMIASYGMPVGASVFDTCVFIGQLKEAISIKCAVYPQYIYRKDEKMNLCGTMKAKDSNIRQALIDRFGVVGTKKDKGWFYGFKSDIWSAMAVSCTYYDMYLKVLNE